MLRVVRIPVLAALAALACPSLATAGPIRWSYSSTGGEGKFDEVYLQLLGREERTLESDLGARRGILPVKDWTWTADTPDDVFGSFGPVNVAVQVTDLASGESGELVVPYFGSFDISPTDDRVG